MLVSRVACLGKIRHQQKAYSGGLSRHLLAYQSIISSVHATLRDLMEMILVSMFLEGLVDRERDDWVEISLGYTSLCAGFMVFLSDVVTACPSAKSSPVLLGS